MVRLQPGSLKLKLTFGAIIFGTLLLLAQSVIQFYSLRGELAARIESEQFSFLSTVAEHLEERISHRLHALEAASPTIPVALLDHPDVLTQYLRSKTTLLTLFDDLFIFDANGTLLVDWPTHPGRRGLDLSDRDYITTVRQKKQSTISQPLLGRASGQPMIILAAPVKDADGQLRAIIAGVLNLQNPRLIGEISKTRIGQSGYLYLVSAEGKFIAHPDQSRILQAIPQRGVNHALDRAFYEGFEGTEEGVNSRGLQGLFTFKRLPSTGWLLASVVPSAEAMRPVINVQRNMVSITLLLIVLLIPLLWFLLARLMRPLGQLADEMRARATHMALGQAPAPIAVSGSGEIRTASAAFNEFLEARNRAEAALLASETARQHIMENLEKAKIAAEAANDAKSRFLANMSHEIRTPMHGVIGMLDLALMNPLDDETRDYLQTARSSAESLLLILNGILDISRIEAGKLEIEQTPFSLPRLLQEANSLMYPSIVQKHLHLRLRLPEDLPALTIGDPLRIRQVILNLLGNALKFTEQGEIQVIVDILEHSESLLRVRIAVSDTGIGIQADRLESIFQAFTQADGSTTRRFGGTGLGLTISRQLVELMGGEMHVSSQQGQGSCFSFTLPLGLPTISPERAK
ncbi:MAG: ATP-binding protein [Rhodocyclales bacterium]|nr:ATP-binding protein [Rhodocyclales bacterium]